MNGLSINCPELLDYLAINTKLPSRCTSQASYEEFADFCLAEIEIHGDTYRTYDCIGSDGTHFPVLIREYQGVYFVQAPEFDDRGFFLDVNDALKAAEEIVENFSSKS